MNNWERFGWSLLIIGLITEGFVMGAMIWALSSLGYHWGAVIVTLIVGFFLYDQVHDYGEDV